MFGQEQAGAVGLRGLDVTGPRIRIYRWIVLLLAAGYWLYLATTSSYSAAFGPFRFLTIWALTCSVLTAWQLLAISRGKADDRWDGFVSMTAVVNAMVVFLYWRLFLSDPASVGHMIQAGVGSHVTLQLGGKVDMLAIGRRGAPLEVSGVVRAITDGEFLVTGPMSTGTRAHMGRTAVLDTGGVEIVVTELNHEPWDLGCFRSVGIEPTQRRYLLLKSRIHFRAGFEPIAKHIIECDGVGVTSSDYSLFNFTKLERPAYPLDLDMNG